MKFFDVLFAVIAMRDVIFFANVADKLRERGYNVGFITFYEPGDAYLEQKGYDVFSIHKATRNVVPTVIPGIIDRYQLEFGIDNLRNLFLHEKLTFNRYDEDLLEAKAVKYFDFFRSLFQEIRCNIVVQELGGFIAHLTLFYSAKKAGLNHIFLEPALFKGRLFFTSNEINCDIAKTYSGSQEVQEIVSNYLHQYNLEKTVAIPRKDIHHFKDATLSKLVNTENMKKLGTKLINKYAKGLDEEFDAIGNHVKRYVKMYFNRKRIGRLYSLPSKTEKYVYFPFHVPLDFQLTVRSNEYLDQITLLKFISNILPAGTKLYVKEHPASIGAYSYDKMMELLVNQNVRLIHPSVNSYDLIANAKCVITINSKVGAEALMQQRKVIVLGSAFYIGQGLTVDVDNVKDLRHILPDLLQNDPDSPITTEEYLDFFCRVYESCMPGELYQNSESNINAFVDSISVCLTPRVNSGRDL